MIFLVIGSNFDLFPKYINKTWLYNKKNIIDVSYLNGIFPFISNLFLSSADTFQFKWCVWRVDSVVNNMSRRYLVIIIYILMTSLRNGVFKYQFTIYNLYIFSYHDQDIGIHHFPQVSVKILSSQDPIHTSARA